MRASHGGLAMPKYDGVYQDSKGRWYFKVWLGRDPLSGRQS